MGDPAETAAGLNAHLWNSVVRGGGALLWICYLGNHFFCIVNLRPEM
jgi:hypothetical protein